ncbi:MAG TPA: amidohydrolase family protein, partial [Cyclobacteriaceae bacterium]|nr:amidohydrolase family protein [Cyclobacteriaceae bacterium]
MQKTNDYYQVEDYHKVEKYDVHTHVLTYDPRFIEYAREDLFSLISINVDVPEYPSLREQMSVTKSHADAFPENFSFSTSFGVSRWGEEKWLEATCEYLSDTIEKGAIAVKVWKNIGMELLDEEGKFVMIDHPRFDPLLQFMRDKKVTLIGHLGEPRNCWLPVEEMTVSGDKDYFSKHPEYHMYLHPEYPSYEEQIQARDHMLEKHPDLLFVGAHLASLEYDVDELAKRLDKFPNMAVDMAERISHLQHQAVRDWQKVRDFVIKYQDRLLYGTDLVDDGSEDANSFKRRCREIRLRHWEFFVSDHEMQVPKVTGTFQGLHLPKRIVNKIYYDNAKKWFPALAGKSA